MICLKPWSGVGLLAITIRRPDACSVDVRSNDTTGTALPRIYKFPVEFLIPSTSE
ncbi:hypothetical protein CY34DRAFT_809454 [Suillus luteus UH-Slu-Lm8-n1]|uniref:Uncharacterized protein n=1 Tax=Suillus luteus UH-Slu-Lm8-n1 TaxID=930992 RepID=A0A0D0AVA8_9AGAM|nr:hypothetical protein CY34DRAFT_809454 [Suillus luteus UH-Slu-Lm8-n1]